jgi:DNA-binding transcriptional ArsR family regulator
MDGNTNSIKKKRSKPSFDYWKDLPKDHQISERVEIMRNLTEFRIQILILLWVFGEVSLTQLTKLTQKVKSTLSYHLEKLLELNIIIGKNKKPTKDIKRGRYYSVHPDIFHRIGLSLEYLESLAINDAEHMFLEYNKMTSWVLKVFSSLYAQIADFYQNFDHYYQILGKEKISNVKKRALMKTHTESYSIEFLTEHGYRELKEYLNDWETPMRNIIDRDDQRDKNMPRPYVFMNSLFPIMEIMRYQPILANYDLVKESKVELEDSSTKTSHK